jgi:hypothetical protein
MWSTQQDCVWVDRRVQEQITLLHVITLFQDFLKVGVHAIRFL